MDEYAVKLTPRALRDLDEIYAYIADTLLERGTAEALVERLEKGILSLDSDKRVKKKTPETVRFRAFPMAQWEGFEFYDWCKIVSNAGNTLRNHAKIPLEM